MFIRRTNTRDRHSGEAYFTYRLVAAARVGKAVKQRTLLNLGTHFDLPQTEWPALATRIDQLLDGQASLLAPMLSERRREPGTALRGAAHCPASAAGCQRRPDGCH